MDYVILMEPKIEGAPYYCISADRKEIRLDKYENGLRGFILEELEVTPKAFNLVAKFKAPDGRSYTMEIAPNGKVLKATFYGDEAKPNPENDSASKPMQGGRHEKFKREKCDV